MGGSLNVTLLQVSPESTGNRIWKGTGPLFQRSTLVKVMVRVGLGLFVLALVDLQNSGSHFFEIQSASGIIAGESILAPFLTH